MKHVIIIAFAVSITTIALILNSSQNIKYSLDYYKNEITKRDSIISERDRYIADYQAVMRGYYTTTEALLDTISCHYDDFLDTVAETDIYSFYCIAADKLDSLQIEYSNSL